MNKKVMLLLLCLVVITGVSATLIEHYGQKTVSMEIESSITVSGESGYTLTDIFSGNPPVTGDLMTAVNNAPFTVDVLVTNDNTESEIGVSYVSELTLTEKVVDFTKDVWEIPVDAETATVLYTMIGGEFTAEVTEGAKEGYTLIYYKDNSDRFSSPAKAIAVEDVVGNLPYEDDRNNDEYNYCDTGEYDTCFGAKVWYVPQDAINGDDTIDWSRASEFLYETKLVQYNADGEITVYPETSIGFNPVFTIGDVVGSYTITTSVDPM